MKKTKESWQGHNKRGIPEFRAAYHDAKSGEEMIKIFKKIESRLEEKQLGSDCWAVALQLHKENQDHENIMSFGKRALNIFLHEENSNALGIRRSSLAIGNLLHVLGSACFELKRYGECLSYLNWSDRNLSKLLADNYEPREFVLKGLHNTHGLLYRIKKDMGRKDEALFHARKVLEIDEKMLDDGRIELGKTNKDVSDAYFQVGKFEEALPFSLKALEIYKKHMGDDSGEVTVVRMGLGGIYSALKDFGKAFEQNRLSLSGLKSMGSDFRLLMAELEGCQLLVDLGRYEEALEALKPVTSQVEMLISRQNRGETVRNQGVKAITFMIMAKALCGQEKFANARKYIKSAVRIMENKGLDPKVDVIALVDMSKLYEQMKEYESAILLVQKALDIPELPPDHFAKCSMRVFSLVSLSGTEEKRLSSLEEVVERLKVKFGPKHYHVGFAYAKLGRVYMNLGRPDMAAETYKRADDIIDASLGTHQPMESDDLAIEAQKKLVEGLKGLGLSEQDRANAAVKILKMMKGRDIGEVGESDARALY